MADTATTPSGASPLASPSPALSCARARFFWTRLALLLGLAGAFWLTGAARALAAHFPVGDWHSYPLFAALCILTFEALLFPIGVLARNALSDGAPDPHWLRHSLYAVLAETFLGAAAAMAMWLAVRHAGALWWLLALPVAALATPAFWPHALRLQSRNLAPIEDPAFLDALNPRLREAGLRPAASLALFAQRPLPGAPPPLVHYHSGVPASPQLVFLRDAWMSLPAESRLFLAIEEALLRRWRPLGHLATLAGLTLVVALAGQVAAAVAAAENAPHPAVPVAFPAFAFALFALATFLSLLRNAVSRRAHAAAGRRACRLLGLAPPPAPRLPWWAAILQSAPPVARRLPSAPPQNPWTSSP